MKKNKAITLIALIVTIIILLILAGVSIAFLTGENGILNKAKTAKDQSTQGEVEEQNRLGKTNEMIDSYTTRGTGIITTNNITRYSTGVKTFSLAANTARNADDFVAPSDGFISAVMNFYSYNQASTSYIETGITLNGTFFAWDQEAAPSAGTYRMVSAAGMIEVLKGDIVKSYCYSNGAGNYTYSYGYMFYPNS